MAELTQSAEIIRVADLSSHVRELVLSPLETKLSYQPGQWISLKLPIGPKPPLNRAYSMATPEDGSGQLTIAFDRVPGGLGSQYLYKLVVGDRVLLSGPYGHFICVPQHNTQALLIGRFTGIVPIRCIVRSHLFHSHSVPVTVIAAAPAESELLYHKEFIDLAAEHAQFQYKWIIYDAGDQRTANDVGAVLDLVRGLTKTNRDWTPMICGLKQFVRPLRAYFMDLGFDRKAVRVETYD